MGGEALSIRQMIEKTIGAHGIERTRVFITGLSAGGAMSAAMLAVYPGLSIATAVLGLNLLGDGLRDLFDPRLARER